MPYKDPEIRRVKAREYQASHRAKVKQNTALNPVEPRNCQLCGTDITAKRKDARFCSREHKRSASDAQRDYQAEYANNKEHKRALALTYYYKDVTKSRKKMLLWQKNNATIYAANAAKYRASKAQRTPVWLDEDSLWMISQAYELAALRTKLFGFSWHVDHVLPLHGRLVSGLHVPNNLQVIPGLQNIAKNNRFEVAA